MNILNLFHIKQDFKTIHKTDEKTASRLRVLESYTRIKNKYLTKESDRGKKHGIASLCSGAVIGLRTLQRWEESYRNGGIKALITGKSSGRPTTELDNYTKGKIKKMRKNYRWGPEVIQAHLIKQNKRKVSQFKINKYLNISKLRAKFPCTTIKAIKKNKTKKHNKVVIVHTPGDHTQIDVKFLTQKTIFQEKLYVFNFIDHASNVSDPLTTSYTNKFLM